MKKIIAIIVAAVVVIGAGTFAAFRIFKFKENKNDNEYAIDVSFDDFTLYDTMFTNISMHPDRYLNSFITNYSMDDETAQSLIDTPEDWLSFNLFVYVSNPNDDSIGILDIKVDDNGKDDIYIQEALSSSMNTISAGGEYSLCIPVLVHNNEPSLDEVQALVMEKSIYINYVVSPETYFEEIPAESVLQAKVQMK